MKRILLFFVGCLIIIGSVYSQAEDFLLWESQTFTAADTVAGWQNGEIVAISSTVGNSNSKNAIQIIIVYEGVTPDGDIVQVSGSISGEVQGRISTSSRWFHLGDQFQGIRTPANAPERVIIVAPVLNLNPGVDNVSSTGGSRISTNESNASSIDSFRLILVYSDTGGSAPNLYRVTLTAFGYKYNQ